MNKNLTEIVFILDRSGSMRGLETETINGFNSFIEQQKKQPGKANVTTVLFDNRYEILYSSLDLNYVPALTSREYYVRGMTAYMDALGRSIDDLGKRLRETPENERPANVIVVVTTDGYENASKEYTKPQVRSMVEHQTNKYNWQFIFLGADINAEEVASELGISMAATYSATEYGTRSMYSAVSNAVTSLRDKGSVDENWDKDIE